jgi:hypothetical protein
MVQATVITIVIYESKTFIVQATGVILYNLSLRPLFVDRMVRYSALFTNLVRWHAGAVSFPPRDIILAQLACPLSDVMFLFTFWKN